MTIQHVFFFDSRVNNWQALIDRLPPGSQWFELNALEDGVQQILGALEGLQDLGSIHIVSHGSPGLVLLGSTEIDAAALTAGAAHWAQIGSSLAEGGDILLYGCEVGAGVAGNGFLQRMAAATGADVAANADLTGIGGDWSLEATAGGVIEAQTLAASSEVGTLLVTVNLLVGTPNTVTLSPRQWETLSATLDPSITTANNITYQWAADGTNILGATSKDFFLEQDLVSKSITVAVTYVDGVGQTQFLTSAPTLPVENVDDAPTGGVTISGTAQEGETLSAANTLADLDGPSPLGISYQWRADGVDIDGATRDKLVLAQEQVGKSITVEARYTDAFGNEATVLSPSTSAVVDIDSETTGTVTISGVVVQGGTLTGANNLGDPDGMGTVRYQWYADGQAISGAVGDTLLLTQEQVDRVITLTAIFVDGSSNQVNVTSAPTFPVANVNDPPKGTVVISGTAQEDSLLTASHSLADTDGIGGVSYQWQADGIDIAGATSDKLLLTQTQVGKSITVEARYTDGFGRVERVVSASTAAVLDVDHATTGDVFVSGLATQGATLTASNSLADADGMGTVRYQWNADGLVITRTDAGQSIPATGNALVLTQAEVGKVITVTASFTDGQGTAVSRTSVPTFPVSNVNDPPRGEVTISGTAEEGLVLTADATGLSDLDGMGSVSFQWYTVENLAQGAAFTVTRIPGATGSTLKLGQSYVGKALMVEAIYFDKFGNDEVVQSASTSAVVNVTHAPTGVVTVQGEFKQGKTLTAVNGLADKDGLGAISYQWEADGVVIPGATGSSLTLTQAQVGKAITVTGSYTDGEGTAEAETSVPSTLVANVNDAPTGSVAIAGTAVQGGTLYAADTLDDLDDMGTVAYQWLANGVDIAGATSGQLAIGQSLVGKTISVLASYTDGGSKVERVFSTATAAVLNVNDAPTGLVTISGTATQGQTLTASNTLADVDGLGSVSYQWSANGVDIPGATGASLLLSQGQVGQEVTVKASYVDGQGTSERVASLPTPPVANVNDAPTGSLTITGTVTQGQTLTALNALADPDGLGVISYVWRANGVDIGTGSSLALNQAQVGKAITVTANYTDGLGQSETVTSSGTAAVVNINDSPTGSVTISGTPTQGGTLTASNTLDDADGMGAISYQWLADGANITGATQATLTLGQAQVGKKIAVKAVYTDASGTAESQLSAETPAAVTDINDPTMGAVVIAGKVEENQTLTVSNTLTDQDGIPASGSGAIAYQWQADGQNVSGATASTLQLTDDLVGKQISVTASYVDAQGHQASLTSTSTDKVANVNDSPTGSVSISGTAKEDETLSVNVSSISDPDGLGTLTYQWRANGVILTGEVGSTLALKQQHVGKIITATVSYTDGNGTVESVTSNGSLPVVNVQDAAAGTVVISGSAEQRQVLTASNTLSDQDGMGVVSYQWNTLSGGVTTPILGATANTLTLLQAQVGNQVSVTASYTDLQGQVESVTSLFTDPVANVNDAPTGSIVINGTTTQGQTLTAVSTLADLDGIPATGPGAVTYQWKAGSAVITGATGNTYLLTQAEVGKLITVTAAYTDLTGVAGSLTSAPRGAVANVNDAPTGFENIAGVPVPGQVLTVPNGLADADGLGTVRYQWRLDGVAITGATASTYTVLQAQVGKVITVTASYTDGFGQAEAKTSSGLAVVSSQDTVAPVVSSFSPVDGATSAALNADIVLNFSEPIQRGSGTILLKTAAGATVEIFDAATSARLSLSGNALTVNPSSDLQPGTGYRVEFAPGTVKDLAGNLFQGVSNYDFNTAASANPGLHGMVYHWKSHVLMQGVDIQAGNNADVVASADLFDLRTASFDAVTGILSVEVWLNPTQPMESFQFRASNLAASGFSFNSAMPVGWEIVSNDADPTDTSIAAIASTAAPVTDALKVGTLQFTMPAGSAGAQVRFSQIAVGDQNAAPLTLGMATSESGIDGEYQFTSLTSGSYGLAVSRDTLDSGNAIQANDALAALRIAVGINPNLDPDGAGPMAAPAVSPYQIMAADVNGSGTVTASDALAILRMAVKLSSAPPQEWLFVEEKRDFWDEATQKFTLNRNSATWDRAIAADPAGGQVNLVAVLKGDVNGSWSAPVGSQDLDVLDPTYFERLAELIGLPNLDQWGGPPPGP